MMRKTPQTRDPASRCHVAGGEVIGTREHSGIHAWRGIPYTSAPSGALRWRAPRPVAPWSGVLEARAYGSMAPQYADLLVGVSAGQRGQITGDEDCLTLNIFARAGGAKTLFQIAMVFGTLPGVPQAPAATQPRS